MTGILLLLGFVLVLWTVEALRLRRALRAVPVRIHVNGSRGKSSVTRLLAAALRESGRRTVAKTTGTRARFILPDGSEEPVVRIGTPNICEQVGVLDRARRLGAEAIVIECMAIRPDLQQVSEDSIIHSTIGVLTNVRADHLDVMGPTLADAARAMAAAMPRGGPVVVGEDPPPPTVEAAVAERGSTLVAAAAADELPAGVLDGFSYLEHAENVATALAVTRRLGITDEVSLRGMHRVPPDPGACTRWRLEHRGRSIEFHNIFAANDLESTIAIWERLGLGAGERRPTVAVLNLRGDRIDRSLQYAEVVGERLPADFYFLVGDFSARVLHRFERRLPRGQLVPLGRVRPAEIFDRLAAMDRPQVHVGGIGNIGGLGHEIIEFVARARGKEC